MNSKLKLPLYIICQMGPNHRYIFQGSWDIDVGLRPARSSFRRPCIFISIDRWVLIDIGRPHSGFHCISRDESPRILFDCVRGKVKFSKNTANRVTSSYQFLNSIHHMRHGRHVTGPKNVQATIKV